MDKKKSFERAVAVASEPCSVYLDKTAVELTNKCNFRCIHCEVKNCGNPFLAQKELTTKQVFTLIDQLAQAKLKELRFSGGEPLLRKDLWEIIEYAKKGGFELHLSTNASLITPEDAKRLADLNILVVVSFYGMDDKTYQAVTGVPNAFQQVMRGIDLLRAKKVKIWGRMPLLKQTIGQWDAFVAYAKKAGLDKASALYRIHATFDGQVKPFNCWVSAKQLEEFFYKNPEYGGKENFGGVPDRRPCLVGTTHAAISASGDILPCALLRQTESNIKKSTISEAWVSPFFRKIRGYLWKDFPKCLRCKAHEFCEPCMGRFFLVTGSYFLPDKYSCRIAWARKRAFDRRQKSSESRCV